jgi:signal transduction histidine kinase
MDRQKAVDLLASDKLHDRLQAARFFSRFASKQDYDLLQAALGPEKVVWIKAALKRGLEVALGKAIPEVRSAAIDAATEEEVADEIYAEAVEETTQRLVHELEPILGTLRFYAGKEIVNYPDSRTKQELDRLESLLEAIDTLSKAAAPPAIKEFDLARLIDKTASSVCVGHEIAVSLAGRRPLVVLGDSSLVEVAFANGLRNAIEATEGSATSPSSPVVVNWDETDRDYYVAVLDRGSGLPLGADRILEIGRTTKKGHLGMGLALADRAIRTIKGKLAVAPREGGGVSYEFRWPKREARAG